MMKRIVVTLSLVCALLVIASSDRPVKVAAQVQAPCVAYVPAEWGTYKGASASYGLGFEDSDGTVRFVNQIPCSGLHQAPTLALELRRK
jgi:hypothetical protein